MALHPVILCGGSGTRLWPLSRAMLPKQFLPLASERTMIQETALRLSGLRGAVAPAIVSHLEQRFLAAEQLREVGVPLSLHLLEPEARNTAPAIAAAALCIARKDPEAMLLVLPSDHAIRDVPAFHEAIQRAMALAKQGRLVTFGMVPSEPATGYGYIKRGAAEPG